jgi:hypothetical protein
LAVRRAPVYIGDDFDCNFSTFFQPQIHLPATVFDLLTYRRGPGRSGISGAIFHDGKVATGSIWGRMVRSAR